nr:unnamed protein product [Callosobruchus analis]
MSKPGNLPDNYYKPGTMENEGLRTLRVDESELNVYAKELRAERFFNVEPQGSLAYLDPGNIECDSGIGAAAEYRLLWVLLSSTIAGILMQRLAVRLGVVTGMHLAEICHIHYKTVPRILLWVMIEITIVGADMQEVEAMFAFQIGLMLVCFGYQFFSSDIDPYKLMIGMFLPWCEDCDNHAVWQAIRVVDITKQQKVRDAYSYFFAEVIVALLISFVINVFVASAFAQLYRHTNRDVRTLSGADWFKQFCFSGAFIACKYGPGALYIWAIGLYCSGQSATMSAIRRLATFNNIVNAVMAVQMPFATIPLIAFTSNPNIMGNFANSP